jgi:RNA-directed DNA polymerase
MAFENWIKNQIAYQRNKKGRYLHFDRLIKLIDKKGKADPNKVALLKQFFDHAEEKVPKHSFYPFIKADIVTPRVKHQKDPTTGKKKPYIEDKVRPIAYASHFDSMILSWYSHQLTAMYEQKLLGWGLDDCVSAYLSKDGKCNIHYADEVFQFIKQKLAQGEECVALAFDLSSYFDSLDHNILKKQWCKVLGKDRLPKDHYTIFKMLTNYSFIDKEYLDIRFPSPINAKYPMHRICEPAQFREMVQNGQVIQKNPFFNQNKGSKRYGKMCGIPQGSSLSACLSNIYLIEFDRMMNVCAKNKNGLYRRYCDDLLVVCTQKNAKGFERLINWALRNCEVVINEKKTEKIFFSINDGQVICKNEKGNRKHLQYLGFEFDGENAFIRSSSMSRYHRRLSSKAFQSVEDAYCSEFGQKEKIFRKKLYNKFTHLGKRNFIKYGQRAIGVMGKSKTIRKQIKKSVEKVEGLLQKYRDSKEANLQSQKLSFKTKL